ncbi:unnamed protein product, partial [Iphiclides podalirius]
MRIDFIWILLLILPYTLVNPQPIQKQPDISNDNGSKINQDDSLKKHDEQVISSTCFTASNVSTKSNTLDTAGTNYIRVVSNHHGVQKANNENCKQENCKVGYVVEGRQYKKYRVEERTSDGFIVGEYGVVRNEDGALRGVRYTADSEASPRLIQDALMKFLQLK